MCLGVRAGGVGVTTCEIISDLYMSGGYSIYLPFHVPLGRQIVVALRCGAEKYTGIRNSSVE